MNCPLCRGQSAFLTDQLRRGNGTVYHCSGCDLGFLQGTETDYNGPYRQSATPDCTTPQEIFLRYAPYQEDRLKLIRPHLGESILEFGASAGQFLHHVNVPRRCAVEPDEACMAYMESHGIARPGLLERFDTVCAFQVMEHTVDPVAFLTDALGRLNPGGAAFIEVPNLYDPLRSVWRIPTYEKFYFHQDHRFYFSAKSLRKAAEMAGAADMEIIPMQDYNVLNALHWITTGTPQADCRIGLSAPNFGQLTFEAIWLAREMKRVDAAYKEMLEQSGKTANLMLVVTAQTLPSTDAAPPVSSTPPQSQSVRG